VITGSRRELEYDARALAVGTRVGPAVGSGSIQVPLLVEDKSCYRRLAISAVGLRTEAVEDRLVAFWSKLEHDARPLAIGGPVGPTQVGRPIQVSLLVEDQLCVGIVPVGAVGLCAEAVEDCLLAFWNEFEYYAAAILGLVGTASDGRPIQAPTVVEDEPCCGAGSIGAVLLRTKAVENCLVAPWSQLEYDAELSIARPAEAGSRTGFPSGRR